MLICSVYGCHHEAPYDPQSDAVVCPVHGKTFGVYSQDSGFRWLIDIRVAQAQLEIRRMVAEGIRHIYH